MYTQWVKCELLLFNHQSTIHGKFQEIAINSNFTTQFFHISGDILTNIYSMVVNGNLCYNVHRSSSINIGYVRSIRLGLSGDWTDSLAMGGI